MKVVTITIPFEAAVIAGVVLRECFADTLPKAVKSDLYEARLHAAALVALALQTAPIEDI